MTVFFSPQGLADYLGLPVATIYKWRHQRHGPPGIRIGAHVRFRKSAVEEWLDQQAEAS